jgi:cation:H+ antiporter
MVIAMSYMIHGARKASLLASHDEIPQYRMLTAVPMLLLGLFALYLGGQLLVDGAVQVAEALGVKQWVIGVIIVALGTSMPEVAASVVAAVRGHGDMAVGNVFGSNLFNTFFVLGTGASIQPVTVKTNIHGDLLLFTGLTLVGVLPIALRGRLTRPLGAVMLCGYLGFVILRILSRA